MLSKPYAESSGGSSDDVIDVERQQIADRVGVFGAVQPVEQRPARDWACAAAARSSAVVSHATSAARVCRVRRGAPCGGIIPTRSFLMSLLPDAGLRGDVRESISSSASPPVFDPLVMTSGAVFIDGRVGVQRGPAWLSAVARTALVRWQKTAPGRT